VVVAAQQCGWLLLAVAGGARPVHAGADLGSALPRTRAHIF
jgi:hypothetical protein